MIQETEAGVMQFLCWYLRYGWAIIFGVVILLVGLALPGDIGRHDDDDNYPRFPPF